MRNDGDALPVDSIKNSSADVGRQAADAAVEGLNFSYRASPQWASPQKVARASAPLVLCSEGEFALGEPIWQLVIDRGGPKDDVVLCLRDVVTLAPKGQGHGTATCDESILNDGGTLAVNIRTTHSDQTASLRLRDVMIMDIEDRKTNSSMNFSDKKLASGKVIGLPEPPTEDAPSEAVRPRGARKASAMRRS